MYAIILHVSDLVQSSAFKCLVCFRFGGARKKEEAGEGEGEVDKDKPDYGLSGKLTAETNTYRVSCMCVHVQYQLN